MERPKTTYTGIKNTTVSSTKSKSRPSSTSKKRQTKGSGANSVAKKDFQLEIIKQTDAPKEGGMRKSPSAALNNKRLETH